MDEEAKRKDAKIDTEQQAWRILGGTGWNLLESLRSAVQHRLNSCLPANIRRSYIEP
jgi:hypothetical protein